MSRGRVGWRTGSPDRLNDLVGAQSWNLFGVAAAPPAPAPAYRSLGAAASAARAPSPNPPAAGGSFVPPAWCVAPNPPSKAQLAVYRGAPPQRVSAFRIGHQRCLVAGRSPDVELVLEHPSASRRHAALLFHRSGALYLVDLGSAHGTFLDGERLPPQEPTLWPDGARCVFGASPATFVLELGGDAAPPQAVYRGLAASAPATADGDGDDDDGDDAMATDGGADIELCSYYEKLEKEGTDAALQPGVYTLEELKRLGRTKGWCPYFLARHVISFANVVVYNYQYLLDPKIAQLVSSSMQRECVVVFDEAHNIDNICIEVMSINFRLPTLDAAQRNLGKLRSDVDRLKATDARRLNDEYQRLVAGLQTQGAMPTNDGGCGFGCTTHELPANPVLPADILQQAVPGNLRRADSFVRFLARFVAHVRRRMSTDQLVVETPTAFLARLMGEEEIEAKPLKFVSDRLRSLLRTLEVTDVAEYAPLMLLADFASLCATYTKGFAILVEPYDERMPTVRDPLFQFCCNDASIAIKPVFERFQSVVITSGTLSPIDMYPKILGFEPCAVHSFAMSFARDVICPLVVTRGADQASLSSKFDMRSDAATVRNYGKLLLELAAVVPDGMVAFFTSYSYMQEVVRKWEEMEILSALLKHKLIFIETTDVLETTLALENFKRACDAGRGAVFLSIARGKVAEGVDFDRHYGRAVLLLGIPFQYTLSRVLRARLDWMRETCGINEADFLTFDAIRQAAQCAGRVIRGKSDYGLVVFADKRYAKADKREKLPRWIQQFMGDGCLNLSTELALHRAKAFLREMAQPAAPSQNVSLDRDELGRSAGYVARVATAAIAAHPLQATETLHGAVSAEPPPAAQPMDTG